MKNKKQAKGWACTSSDLMEMVGVKYINDSIYLINDEYGKHDFKYDKNKKYKNTFI